mgnify:CR=1 FL=1
MIQVINKKIIKEISLKRVTVDGDLISYFKIIDKTMSLFIV